MFRPMVRTRQQLSDAECAEILQQEVRGVLSVLGDEGYPYGVPIDYWYCPEEGRIYFHSGRKGHKVDAFTRDNKASFCVYDQGYRVDGAWPLHIRSIIAFGRIGIVEDPSWGIEVCRRLSLRFTGDEQEIQEEIDRSWSRTLVFYLQIEHMTGKLVKES
ncbi:MAG: pyridoxamine 5'-phosphate oxidase family protein [Firmicutes bacterium]|nr:pyridoxamine 5'-phosphate oxidase family protein [Bacillota bacterium]